MKKPRISIIVSTKNASASLEQCLKSVKSQTYNDTELIVVDNYSKDATKNIALKYTRKVYNKGPERSAQRNFGVSKSTGSIIAWFDADMELTPKVAAECISKLSKNPGLSALVVPEKSEGIGFWAACRALEKKCYLGDTRIEAVRVVRKDVFNKVGKLNSGLISGEDWDITARLREKGFKTGRIKSFVIHYESKLSLLGSLKKKYYYAQKSLPYVQRHIRGPMDVVLFLIRPAFFRNYRLLAADPIHAAGLFFMKLCEFGVGAFGIINAQLKK